MISVYGGSSFIAKRWAKQTKLLWSRVPRNETAPKSGEALYFISTTDNYAVFDRPTLDIETNLTALMERLQHFRAGDTFNFISSWFVYGNHNGEPVSEFALCDPRGFYSITKRAAEQLLVSYCMTHKINWRIFRLSNIYGPGDPGSPKKNALTYLISELRANHPIRLYWGGDCIRDYLHVADCAAAIDLCLEKAPLNSITNIGSGAHTRFGDLIMTAADILGSNSTITACEPPAFHAQVQARHFSMDISKLTSYGFIQKVPMTLGLRELCQ